jgi:hypothetical protein
MNRSIALGAALLAAPIALAAQAPADTSWRVTFGGFVDAYYAYDFGEPADLDRSFASGATFTTQPARHNEFNVNLAYVEAIIAAPRVRGRLALQAGTSVQSNYAGEPTMGVISGPTLSRHLQEAYAGVQVLPALWIDGGIFYSHMGMESWASKDNLTYTRSLVAEYSPYYSTGVRAVWQLTPALLAHIHVVNGWQNISETNEDKGVGVRLDLTASPAATVSYYGFLNSEAGGRRRIFNGVGAKLSPTASVTLLAQLDYGTIEQADETLDNSTWYGFTAIGRLQLSPKVAVAARVERYDDEDQVNIATGLGSGFRGNGASLGLDVMPSPRIMWRTEVRGFSTNDRIFPEADEPAALSDRSVFMVTSLAVLF